jgi:hypothetical protein
MRRRHKARRRKVEGSLKEIEDPEEIAAPDGLIEGALNQMIEVLQDKLTSGETVFSVSDLLRLLQTRKQLGGTPRGGVTMRWVTEWDENPEEE